MRAELTAFLAVAVVVIVTPGQDTALTIKNTLAGGRRGGIFTALGVVSGQVTWALAASVGLAGLLVASEPAFLALKLAGAAYLVYLGAHALVRALARRSETGGAVLPSASPLSAPAAYRQGIVSNLGNPKIAVFFTSLLPQFVPTAEATFAALLALGLLFASMTLVWLVAYAVVVAKARRVLGRTPVRRALDALTGAVLIGLGIRLAAQSR